MNIPHKQQVLQQHKVQHKVPGLFPIALMLLAGAAIMFIGLMPAKNDNTSSGKPTFDDVVAAGIAVPTAPIESTETTIPNTYTVTPIQTVAQTPNSTPTATRTRIRIVELTRTAIPVALITRVPRATRTRAATATRVPTSVFTRIAATHIAHNTVVASRRETIQTRVALTHAPTRTPGARPAQPSPTPIMGMLPGCGGISSTGPQATSCWRGVVDGHVVEVYAGREGQDGDRLQGLIWLHFRGQQGADIYQTPQRVGAVRITAVSGMRFTLQTVSQATPVVFTFDLDTRQWVSP